MHGHRRQTAESDYSSSQYQASANQVYLAVLSYGLGLTRIKALASIDVDHLLVESSDCGSCLRASNLFREGMRKSPWAIGDKLNVKHLAISPLAAHGSEQHRTIQPNRGV